MGESEGPHNKNAERLNPMLKVNGSETGQTKQDNGGRGARTSQKATTSSCASSTDALWARARSASSVGVGGMIRPTRISHFDSGSHSTVQPTIAIKSWDSSSDDQSCDIPQTPGRSVAISSSEK